MSAPSAPFPPAAPPGARPGKWWPLVAICLGNFMLLIDVTIVVTALPSMAQDLDAGFTDLQWVMDLYALALAALVMVAGTAGDLLGRRRVYALGLAAFAVASLVSGLAPNVGVLIAARALQGVAAAAMLATNTPLLAAAYTGRDRAFAFGIWGAVSGAASALGVLLGGVLTDYLDWRWIFYVNLPVCALALLITWRTVAESRGAASRIDWPGTATFTVSAAALTYGLIRGGEDGWGDAVAVAAFAVAAVALLLFLLVERRTAEPLLDLRMLRRPSFAALMAAALILTGAAFAHYTYTMLWLQSVQQLTPIRAGLAVVPMAVTAFVVSGAGGRFLHRLPAWVAVSGGLALIGVGLLTQTAIGPGSDWTVLLPGLIISGAGVGTAIPVLVAAALAAAPPERAGMASGAVNTFRQLGFALGVAVLGTLFSGRIREVLTGAGLTEAAARAVSGGAPLGSDQGLVREAYAAALERVYLTAGLAAVVTALLVAAVARPSRTAAARAEAPAREPLPTAR
ncbi:MFS transporter [Streptomyces avicenniae]|uniref:MFS transporter n=1 Tax=Streptomyces avicenniae TaxID=500153 RepID=UPI00069B853E|nr:MFS transporter [Streptomyces avicenniae]